MKSEKIIAQATNPETFATWHKRVRANWDGVVHFQDGGAVRIDRKGATAFLRAVSR